MEKTGKGGKRKSATDKDQLIKTSKENKVELSEDELKRVSGGSEWKNIKKINSC